MIRAIYGRQLRARHEARRSLGQCLAYAWPGPHLRLGHGDKGRAWLGKLRVCLPGSWIAPRYSEWAGPAARGGENGGKGGLA